MAMLARTHGQDRAGWAATIRRWARGGLSERAREARGARGLGVRAGLRQCTRCTRPVFGPVQLGIFPESIFGHCS